MRQVYLALSSVYESNFTKLDLGEKVDMHHSSGNLAFIWQAYVDSIRLEYILQKEKPDFVVLSPFVLHPLYWAKDEIVYAMEGQFEAWIKVFGDILSRWSSVDFIIISCEPTQHAILKEDRNYWVV